ncbi:MAG: copper homeostasis protein CutC [Bacteroidota bacterium]
MKKDSVLLEVCTNSLDSARQAQLGGAHRIELCSALELGGLTPSAATLQLVRKYIELPIFVLIRPRAGHFCYSPDEREVIFRNIDLAKQMGADGIVGGALTPDGQIDLEFTQRMIEISAPLPFTFHRAFDRCREPMQAMELLIAAGVQRILSSGQAVSAVAGQVLLKQMVEKAGKRLTILGGAGINSQNAKQLVQQTGLEEIHFSAKQEVVSSADGLGGQGNGLADAAHWITDSEEVKRIKALFA